MADGELKTPLSTTPTEDFNPLAEDPDDFISGHSPQRQGHHDADCSGSEEESDYQCNSMEKMATGNLYGVTPPTYIRGVKETRKNTIAMTTLEGLLLVGIHSSQLSVQGKEFESLMGKMMHLVNKQTSCHQAITESLTELKASKCIYQQLFKIWLLALNCDCP
eukprot:XP_019918287.1 PREDICTED: uncharacterized protein LOC109617239 [Crassostrea gigas]